MDVWIVRLNEACTWISAVFCQIVLRRRSPRTLDELFRMAALQQELATTQLSASSGQESFYRVNGSVSCLLERNRHLLEAKAILGRLDSVLNDARRKLVEIEAALSLPVKRGQKPDKLDQQNLRAVKQHLGRLEETARRLSRLLEEQQRKQVVPALV